MTSVAISLATPFSSTKDKQSSLSFLDISSWWSSETSSVSDFPRNSFGTFPETLFCSPWSIPEIDNTDRGYPVNHHIEVMSESLLTWLLDEETNNICSNEVYNDDISISPMKDSLTGQSRLFEECVEVRVEKQPKQLNVCSSASSSVTNSTEDIDSNNSNYEEHTLEVTIVDATEFDDIIPKVSLATDLHDLSDIHSLETHGKINFLFGKMSIEKRQQLLFDDVSLYSITDQWTADQITTALLELPGVDQINNALIDGTACVGGNAISFASPGAFSQVWAVEMDPMRFRLLEHNIKVSIGKNTAKKHVRCLNDDFISLIKPSKIDNIFCNNVHSVKPTQAFFLPLQGSVVFLDPPWGGPGYKRKDSVSLELSGIPLAEICKSVQGRVMYVALKVPMNFAVRQFAMNLDVDQDRISVYTQFRKMLLIVIDYRADMVKLN